MSKQSRLEALQLASHYTKEADEAMLIASEFSQFIEEGEVKKPTPVKPTRAKK